MRNQLGMRAKGSLLVLCVAAACGRPPQVQAPAAGQQTEPLAHSTAASSQAKQSAGLDLAGMDRQVKPGDNFEQYANGTWRDNTEIPQDRSSTGVFYEVFEKAEKRTSELVKGLAASEPAAGSDERRIADYYKAFMDESAIEQRALHPLDAQLAKVDAIKSRTDLARALGAQLRADVDPINATNFETEHLFGVFVAQGLEDPTHNVPYLLQGGLGMPKRDYYLSSESEMVAFRDKYKMYVASLFSLVGVKDSAARADSIVALETKIAQAHATLVESEDPHKANNPWAVHAFGKQAPGLDWPTFFQAAGLSKQPKIIVWQADAVRGLAKLVSSEPLQAWKNWLIFHTVNENSALLPKAYAELHFDFYGHTLEGTPKQRDRWKRALGALNRDLGDAVGTLYAKQYFPASSRAQVEQLVANIIAAFRERVDSLSWMSEATKQKAKAKAATLRVGVGYPDHPRTYAALEIKEDDPLGNHLRAELFEYQHQLAKLEQPVDRGEWWMTAQTVNAVNLPLQNAMNFPAAMLEPPFFDAARDAAANYGAVGAVIGHEISHSFDNVGAEFDAEGRMANWWTPEDQAHFTAAGERLVAQYNAYEALPGLHVNGQQTLGENIADVSGLTIAHAAYVKSLAGKPAPVIDDFTGDQRFFLSYAQTWRTKMRDAALRQRVVADGHAPGAFRALTVRNINTWYTAFSPQPAEKLFLAPQDRVHIW
jgi:putative endopeptidase